MKKEHLKDSNDIYINKEDIETLDLIDPKIKLLNNKAGIYCLTTNAFLEKGLVKIGMAYSLRNRLLSFGLYYPLQKIYLLAGLVHSGSSKLGRGNSVFSIEQEVLGHFKEKLFNFPLRPNYTEWVLFQDKSEINYEIKTIFNKIHQR